MPAKPRAGLLKRPLDIADALFSCPSCSRRASQQLPSALRAKSNVARLSRRNPFNTQRRFTSTISAPVATAHVNKYVPDRYQKLYEALSRVRDVAAEYVDLAQLQLVLRGLESETPVIRVAGTLFGFYL